MTPMENTSDSKLKVTNHVPPLLSWHISVTIKSVCKYEKQQEKTRQDFAAVWHKYIFLETEMGSDPQ